MPILTQKNEVAITITYKCNWNCEYCAVRNNHDYKDNVTHDDVLSKISKIEDNSVVTIFGGEPGLVERKYIEEYMPEIALVITVFRGAKDKGDVKNIEGLENAI